MESGLSVIKRNMTALNLPAAANILDELLLTAQSENLTYQEFLSKLMNHEVITTAILDRILHKSEVLPLTGYSYRIKHRVTIFGPIASTPKKEDQ